MTDLTIDARRETATDLAARLNARINDSRFRARVWTGGEHVRVYTGFGSREYLSISLDGSVERSRSRMTWGHVIDEEI